MQKNCYTLLGKGTDFPQSVTKAKYSGTTSGD